VARRDRMVPALREMGYEVTRPDLEAFRTALA
jgi:hypothetical protein